MNSILPQKVKGHGLGRKPARSTSNRAGFLTLSLLVAFALFGCSTAHYRKSADRETAQVIAEKTPAVPNMDPRFTIEQTNALSLDGLPDVGSVEPYLGPAGEVEKGARVISLEKALEIAVNHSRLYQTRKEQLYLQALDLTLSRHQFTPLFSSGTRARYDVNTEQAVKVGIDALTGQPKAELSEALVEQHRVSGNGSIDSSWLIRDVGRISAAFTTDFFRFLTGDPRALTSSQVGATFLRPLWRDAGFKAAMENLTLAERNLLYQLREFTLFRKTFTVQIASEYYGVLQDRDAVRNSFLSLQSAKKSAERGRALAQEGRTTQADLGRLEQQELARESAWVNAIRNYKQGLDNFKIQLGLSTDASVVLDDKELEQLKIVHPDMNAEEATQIAVSTRLDLLNVREQHEDTARGIKLAANRLKPQVDLVAQAGFNSKQEHSTKFPVPDLDRYRWNAGLNVDLPLERKLERNAYRRALILHEQSARQLEQTEDQIKLQVRNAWRTLDQAKRSYEISEVALKLSQRRVEEQDLLAELGRAKAQDQVDAQNDLFSQKTQLTQALVSHTIARLQFWNSMGILYVKENGKWEEIKNAKSD